MMPATPITSFQGDFRFLSNFWAASVQYEGRWYGTVEHAYQAAKTEDLHERAKIQNAATASIAKHMGKYVPMRERWNDLRLGIMEDLVRQKFTGNPALRQKLIATDPAELIEGNSWNDRFWGVCRGSGENHLGKILMKVRAELLAEPRA